MGRLFVGLSPAQAGETSANDKIIILEDTDDDGVAETSRRFLRKGCICRRASNWPMAVVMSRSRPTSFS